jgi:hypothetical protein
MSGFWAITAYFNPAGYRRRKANYSLFRKHLDLPLLTVELGYGPQFELGEGDADILIQIPGQDVMWQKERLLNRAVAALPPACTKVAWLDGDLIFQSDDWAERTERLLDDCALVQPFGRVFRTGAGWRPGDALGEDEDVIRAVASQIESGMPAEQILIARGEASGTALGMGWAARRELLERRGLYDANIIGDGDCVLLHAAFGQFDGAVSRQKMNRRREDHFRAWAEPFHDDVGGSVGHVSGDVAHLWHGSFADRRYGERVEGFGAFDFDPASDIADDGGAWRWNSPKPAMHAYVRDYFGARREDGAGANALRGG